MPLQPCPRLRRLAWTRLQPRFLDSTGAVGLERVAATAASSRRPSELYRTAGTARRLQPVALKHVFERSGKIRVESAGYPRRDRIRFERYVLFD